MANYDARLQRLEHRHGRPVEWITEDQAKRMAAEFWRRRLRRAEVGPLADEGIADDMWDYCYAAYAADWTVNG
jgi:hypothetical protein